MPSWQSETSRPHALLSCTPTLIAADLLGFLPADWLALGALAVCGAPCLGNGATGWEGGALEWLPLLRLGHLARLYRLRQLFSYLVRDLHLGILLLKYLLPCLHAPLY